MKLAQAERHGHLYPDRHLNVFVPYRSHDLDYNVTRALVSTLRWARPELTRAFVAEVAGVEAAGLEGSVWHHDLQACDYEDFDPSRCKTQVVLGISTQGTLAPNIPSLDSVDRGELLAILRAPLGLNQKLERLRHALCQPDLGVDDAETLCHSLGELEEGGMPDGWVFAPEAGVCVLIEAKLMAHLDLYQLRRYAEVFFERRGVDDARGIVLRRWDQVARFFAVRRDDEDALTAFLCRQLHDYLDVLGLCGWDGFKPYDFDSDVALETLPKFLRFVGALRERAVGQGLPLGDVRPTPTGARIELPTALPGEIALELLETGVRIDLRLGDAPGGRFPGRHAVDVILAPGDAGGRKNPLEGASLASGLRARVDRLVERLGDREGSAAFHELETFSTDLEAHGFEEVLAELRRQHPPAWAAKDAAGHLRRGTLSIGRVVSRDQAIGPADALLERAQATLADLVSVARALAPAAGH
jgi:hypothetical protein